MTVRYLTFDEVVALHAELMRDEGQTSLLIAPDRLESALERPRAEAFGEEFYPALAEKAAALLQGIVIGHPFLDGNKRAGLGAMLVFLRLNGVTATPDLDALYDLVIAVATGELREVADVAARLAALWAPHLDAT